MPWLRRIVSVTSALGAATVALLELLPLDALFPEQVAQLQDILQLVVVLCLLAAWLLWKSLARFVPLFLILASVGLLGIAGTHLSPLVVTFDEFGDPPETRHFLVGYRLTDYGEQQFGHTALRNLSRVEKLRRIGPHAIPDLYGPSYEIVRFGYGLATLLLVGNLVLLAGATEAQRVAAGTGEDP